MSDSGVQVQ